MVPGAWAGDGISGGFHFPIYTFRFSLNQRRPARANLVIRKKVVSRGFVYFFLIKKLKWKQSPPCHPHPSGKIFAKSRLGVYRVGLERP